jgi:cytochrome c-type biogenesis protein CcmH/NrfG
MRFTVKQKRWLAGGSVGVALLLWGVVISRQLASSPVQKLVEQGQTFALRGEAGNAEQVWLRASQRDPKAATIWQLLGDLYLNTSQWDKGQKAFQKLVELAPETPHAYTGLAVATLRLGDEVDAYKWAKEAVKRNPKDASSLQIVAFASGYMGRTEEQLATLRQLLSLQPRDPEVLEMCIEAFSGQKKFDELRKVADALIEIQPTNTMGYGVRALVLLESDGSPEALAAAEKDLVHALQISPLYGYARFQLGRLYLRQNRWNEAILQLEQAQKLSPRQMDVPFELATAYTRAGKLDKAAAARAQFQVLRDETNRLNVVTKKSSLEPDNFEINLEVGEITLKNGDLRRAGYFLGAARKLKPSDPRVKKAYAELLVKIKARTQASQSQ